MKYNHHKIDNFPKHASMFAKIKANIMFAVGITKLTRRKSHLTRKDRRRARRNIRKGDILLVGQHRRFSSLAIQGIVTHAAMYVGHGKIVHAGADGVVQAHFSFVFNEYDTLIIVRPKGAKQQQIKKAIEFVYSQIGKPFDYDFGSGQENFFCSQLVNNAYHHGGFHTGLLSTQKGPYDLFVTALHPSQFLNEHFDVIYYSNSLIIKDGEFILNHKVYKNKFFEYILNP